MAKSGQDAEKKLNQSTKNVSSGFAGMSNAIRQAATALAAFASVGAYIQIADGYAKINGQLKIATDSQKQFNDAMGNVRSIAKSAQADIEGVATLYARLNTSLKTLGATQTQISNITETVALSLKVSGASAAEAQSAMLQLSQAFGAGALRGEEFNAISEAAPSLLRALASAIGRNVGELKAMAAEGKLTSDVLANAFKDPVLLASLQQQAKEVQTISGAYTVLKNEMFLAVGEFDRGTGLSRSLAGALVGLANNLNVLIPIVGSLTVALAGLYSASILAGIARLATGLRALVAVFTGPYGLIALAVGGALAFMNFGNEAAKGIDKAVSKYKEMNAEAKKADPASQFAETQAAVVEQTKTMANAYAEIDKLKAKLANSNFLLLTKSDIADINEKLQEQRNIIIGATGNLSEYNTKMQEIAKAADPLAKANASWEALTSGLKIGSVLQKEFADGSIQIAEAGKLAGKSQKEINEAIEAFRVKTLGAKTAKIEDNDAASDLANSYKDLLTKLVEMSQPQLNNVELLQREIDSYSKLDSNVKQFIDTRMKMIQDKAFKENLDAMNDSLREQVAQYEKLNEEAQRNISVMMSSEEYVRDMELAKLNEAIATAEQNLEIAKQNGLTENNIVFMTQAIARLKELSEARKKAYESQAIEKNMKKETEAAVEEAKKRTDEIDRLQKTVADNFGKAITDAIFRGFENGKSFAKNFKDSLINSFKTLILRPIVQFIVDSSGIQNAIGSIFGGSNGANGATSGGGISGLFGAGKSVFEVFKDGFNAANEAFVGSVSKFGGFVRSLGTSGGILDDLGASIQLYSTQIANVLPYTGAALKLLNGDIKGAAFEGAGVAIGSFFGGPIGGAIGGFIGGAIGGLFGSKKSTPRYSSGVTSTYSNTTGQFDYQSLAGISGFKKNLGSQDTMAAVAQTFSQSVGALLKAFDIEAIISTSLSMFKRKGAWGYFGASVDGVSAGSVYSYQRGGDDTQRAFNDLVNQFLTTGITNAIKASRLPEGIKALFEGITDKTEMQSMLSTTIRLANATEQLSIAFGMTADQAARVANFATESTADLIKYIDEMISFADASMTVGKGLLMIKDSLENAFGNTLPNSMNEFDNYIKNIDKTTQAGIEQVASLFALRPNMVAFTSAIDELRTGVGDSIYAMLDPAEKLASQQADLKIMFESLGLSVPKSAAELIALGRSIDFTTEEGLNLAAVFPTLVTAFDAATNSTNALVDSLRSLAIEASARAGTAQGAQSLTLLRAQFANASNLAGLGNLQAAESLSGIGKALMEASSNYSATRQAYMLDLANIQYGATRAANVQSGIPAFADGGNFTGGLRLVGESGPELEYTGASRIYSNSDTMSMLDNTEVRNEIASLRADMKNYLYAVAKNTGRTADRLDRWDDGDRMNVNIDQDTGTTINVKVVA